LTVHPQHTVMVSLVNNLFQTLTVDSENTNNMQIFVS